MTDKNQDQDTPTKDEQVRLRKITLRGKFSTSFEVRTNETDEKAMEQARAKYEAVMREHMGTTLSIDYSSCESPD